MDWRCAACSQTYTATEAPRLTYRCQNCTGPLITNQQTMSTPNPKRT